MTNIETVRGWFTGRLPQDWYIEPVAVTLDREEILVLGRIAEPAVPEAASAAERSAAVAGRISAFREGTREERIFIAREAEHTFGRKVAWGVRCGDQEKLFTTLAVPVMTRLRQPERQVLDTLVDAGVARSRAEALAWCVKLVGKHSEEWLSGLREAMADVARLREQGPDAA